MGRQIDFVEILVPHDALTIRSEVDISKLKKGDEVFVEILDSYPELESPKITAVGRIVTKPRSHHKTLLEDFAQESKNNDQDTDQLFKDEEMKNLLDNNIDINIVTSHLTIIMCQ